MSTTVVQDQAWITSGVHGTLKARWAQHIETVLIDTEPYGWSVHLTPEQAASLGLALLRAAHEGGADVFEHVRDAAEELTDVEFLAHTLLDDLRGNYADESEQDEKADDEPILTWQEVLALGDPA